VFRHPITTVHRRKSWEETIMATPADHESAPHLLVVIDHTLIYENDGNAVAARCTCGKWAWGVARSRDLLPLEAITGIEAEHRLHLGAGS
jgi:hypothetical protein